MSSDQNVMFSWPENGPIIPKIGKISRLQNPSSSSEDLKRGSSCVKTGIHWDVCLNFHSPAWKSCIYGLWNNLVIQYIRFLGHASTLLVQQERQSGWNDSVIPSPLILTSEKNIHEYHGAARNIIQSSQTIRAIFQRPPLITDPTWSETSWKFLGFQWPLISLLSALAHISIFWTGCISFRALPSQSITCAMVERGWRMVMEFSFRY